MRILAVADHYRHGGSRVVEERAAALARRGHRVALLAGADPERIRVEERAAWAAGLEPVLFPRVPGAGGPRRFLDLARWYRGVFEECRRRLSFDAILFNQPLSAWAVLGSPLRRGAATLYTFHSPWPVEWAIENGLEVSGGKVRGAGPRARLEFAARRWIERKALERCDGITLLSEFMRGQLAEVHPRISREKVALIPGGVDLVRFRPADPGEREARRSALGIPPAARLLLTVRRLVVRMGLESLLQAFRILLGEFPDLRLAVGGAGPLDGSLREMASRLGLGDRARFLGYVSEGAIPGLYAAADLFVLPTARLEGFGLVTVEALACGTPVVGTPVGATKDLLSGIDPRLLSKGAGPREIAEAAAGILRLPGAELRALGDTCRRRVSRLFDGEKVGDALEELLSKLAGQPGPGSRETESEEEFERSEAAPVL